MSRSISVGESISRILTTPLGTRVMRPEYGSDLHLLIDRTVDDEWMLDAIRYTYDAVEANEPDAEITDVKVYVDGDVVTINVNYVDLTTDETGMVTTTMSEVQNGTA